MDRPLQKVAAVLALVMCVGCGGGSTDLDELDKKNKALEARVAILEKDLLEASKKLIAEQQVIQSVHQRVRVLEDAVDKMAYHSPSQ